MIPSHGGIGPVRAQHETRLGKPDGQLGHHLSREDGHGETVLSVQADVDREGDRHPAPRCRDTHTQHHEVEAPGKHDALSGRAHGVSPAACSVDLRPVAMEQGVIQVDNDPPVTGQACHDQLAQRTEQGRQRPGAGPHQSVIRVMGTSGGGVHDPYHPHDAAPGGGERPGRHELAEQGERGSSEGAGRTAEQRLPGRPFPSHAHR